MPATTLDDSTSQRTLSTLISGTARYCLTIFRSRKRCWKIEISYRDSDWTLQSSPSYPCIIVTAAWLVSPTPLSLPQPFLQEAATRIIVLRQLNEALHHHFPHVTSFPGKAWDASCGLSYLIQNPQLGIQTCPPISKSNNAGLLWPRIAPLKVFEIPIDPPHRISISLFTEDSSI